MTIILEGLKEDKIEHETYCTVSKLSGLYCNCGVTEINETTEKQNTKINKLLEEE